MWKETWSHCGCCRTQIENEEETSKSQLESTEAEENANKETSTSEMAPEEPEQNPNEMLRSLLNNEQGLNEHMSYTPQGYSKTKLEYFRFGNTSHFKQNGLIMCPFATWF